MWKHPGPGTYNSNPPLNITNDNVDNYIFICNINIRSVRNKLHFLQNFADEYDILLRHRIPFRCDYL